LELLVLVVSKVFKARQAFRVLLELLELAEFRVLSEPLELLVLEVPLDLLELLVLLERQVLAVFKAL
jgi:hypothetical protein